MRGIAMLGADALAGGRLLAKGADRSVQWRLALAAVLAAVSGLLAALAPLALKDLIDALSVIPSGRTLWGLASASAIAAAYLSCQCAARVLSEFRPVLMNAAEQSLYAHLRVRYLQRLLSLPLQFHLDRRGGALLQEFQQATTGYQIILFHLVNSVIPILVEASTVMLILSSLRQPALTSLIALTALTYLLVTAWRTDVLRNCAAAVAAASADVQAQLAEGLLNVEPIQMYGVEPRTVAALERASGALHDRWTSLQHERMRRGVATIVVFGAAMAASLFLSLRAVLDGSLTVGGFVLSNLYLLQVVRPLEALSNAIRDVHQGLAFIKPLVQTMAVPAVADKPATRADAAVTPAAPPTSPTRCAANDRCEPQHSRIHASAHSSLPSAPDVVFRDVALSFEDRPAVLRRFDLRIPGGKTTAIVGTSGCGKSSLVRLLLRLHEPQHGNILVGSTAITEMPLHSLRAMVAVVPQDVLLLNDSIAVNIGFAREDASASEIERAAKLSGLHGLIASLPAGYATVVGERGLKLSGGERQRIAIARAVLRDPMIYVLDEATSMLDTATETSLMQRFRQIAAGRTTIVIAHRLSTVRHADQIAVLERGRVAEIGTHASLLASGGRYAALWRVQETERAAHRPA